MSALLAIEELTVQSVVAEVKVAVRNGIDSARLADVLASVDWTGVDRADPRVVSILGNLEGWSTEFAEGDISADEYRSAVEGLIAARTGPT